jgi:hypothetical protein
MLVLCTSVKKFDAVLSTKLSTVQWPAFPLDSREHRVNLLECEVGKQCGVYKWRGRRSGVDAVLAIIPFYNIPPHHLEYYSTPHPCGAFRLT